MEVCLGTKGLKNSFQGPFPKTTVCVHCGYISEVAVVVAEEEKEDKYICQLHKTTGKSKELWLHDACAIAIYFCRKCLKPTALYNQG